MTANARFEVFPMVLPTEMGPRCVPDRIEFAAGIEQEVDLSQLTGNGWIDFISGVYCDNFDKAGDVTLVCEGSNQKFIIPAGCAGYYPLLLPSPPKVKITHSITAVVTFQWYNVPVFPLIIPGPNSSIAGSSVNIAQVGGVAVGGSSLPVIGPLTDTELRAASVPVTIPGGGYTDRSITNLSGLSEALMAANANRRFLVVQNVAANPMAINLVGGAAALNTAGSIQLPAGASIILDSYPPTGAINIIGTAGDDVTAMEG